MSDGSNNERVIPCIAVLHNQRLLLLQRSPDNRLAYQWCIPGGKIEPGETPEMTALRELQEETGILAGDLDELGDYLSSAVDAEGKRYRLKVFVYRCPEQPVVKTEPGYGHGWFTLPELTRLRVMEPATQVAFDLGMPRDF